MIRIGNRSIQFLTTSEAELVFTLNIKIIGNAIIYVLVNLENFSIYGLVDIKM